jgi:hypothetical protein
VDSQGVEPWTRGLQDLAVHQHPALACCVLRVACCAGSGGVEPPSTDSESAMLPVTPAPKDVSDYRESNPDPRRGGAMHFRCATATCRACVDRTGFEPVISRLRAWRACRCSNGPCRARPFLGGERPSGARESNAVSPAPKAGGFPSPSPQPRPAPSSSDGRDGSRCPLWSSQDSAPDPLVG